MHPVAPFTQYQPSHALAHIVQGAEGGEREENEDDDDDEAAMIVWAMGNPELAATVKEQKRVGEFWGRFLVTGKVHVCTCSRTCTRVDLVLRGRNH